MRVELGIELLGAAPASFTRDLARRRRIDLSGLFDGDGYARTDAEARKAAAILTRPEEYAALAVIAVGARAFAELLLTPDADVPAFHDRIIAMREAVPASLVATPEGKRHAIAAAEAGLDGVLLDPEQLDFAWCHDCAREAGLPVILSARAGLEAALALEPARLHHVPPIDDPALMERLAEAGTFLHLSPATEGWDAPGPLFHREVRITIGNTAPAWFPADTEDRLAGAHDWDEGVFAKLERNAIDAALCDDRARSRLKEKCNA